MAATFDEKNETFCKNVSFHFPEQHLCSLAVFRDSQNVHSQGHENCEDIVSYINFSSSFKKKIFA